MPDHYAPGQKFVTVERFAEVEARLRRQGTLTRQLQGASGGGAVYPPGGDPGEVLTFTGPAADDVAWSAGTPGPQGPVGPQGLQGVKGDTGAKGDPGVQGPQGVKGDTGAQGPQGLKGDPGVKGDIGVQGPIGPEGPEGDPGPALTVYEQPTEPAGAIEGDVWVDTDAPVPIVAAPMTYGELAGLSVP